MSADARSRPADEPLGGRSRGGALPDPFARLAPWGSYALLVGVALMAVAFLTNPVPDPSFPRATLPTPFRLPFAQPRIEHWPVTYTVGLWIVVFAFPLALSDAYRRVGSRTTLRPTTWLAALPVTAMVAFTTYCRFFWPKLRPATWNAPSYTLVCWLYCSTYDPLWSNLAYAVAAFGAGAAALAFRESHAAKHALAAFGVLAFPLGIPALFEAYRRHADADSTALSSADG